MAWWPLVAAEPTLPGFVQLPGLRARGEREGFRVRAVSISQANGDGPPGGHIEGLAGRLEDPSPGERIRNVC